MHAFGSNVTHIVLNSRVHHRFRHLVRSAPDRFAHVLLELNEILLAFFVVLVFIASLISMSTTKGLVVTDMSGISVFESSKHRRLHFCGSLIGEFLTSSVGSNIVVERSVLTHDLAERLVSVDNFSVESGVFIAA